MLQMKNKCFCGIDTSNYTTSLAICDEQGNVVLNYKKLLPVKDGERGLRQSDAVFHHTSAMNEVSEVIDNYFKSHSDAQLSAIGYSYAPRDCKGSYMPCFLVGGAIAKVLSAVMQIPAFPFSHQSGHIMASLYSAGRTDLADKQFAAFHVSGGTTDVLLVKGKSEFGFDIEQIGGTADLNAGQVIDRVGVYMGLSFPAGAQLEKEALANHEKIPSYKIRINRMRCNLSGIENKACKLYDETQNKKLTAAFTVNAVGEALEKLSEELKLSYPEIETVYAGGVMSCSILKERLKKFSSNFAAPEFSSDNAAGTSLLARNRYFELRSDD